MALEHSTRVAEAYLCTGEKLTANGKCCICRFSEEVALYIKLKKSLSPKMKMSKHPRAPSTLEKRPDKNKLLEQFSLLDDSEHETPQNFNP